MTEKNETHSYSFGHSSSRSDGEKTSTKGWTVSFSIDPSSLSDPRSMHELQIEELLNIVDDLDKETDPARKWRLLRRLKLMWAMAGQDGDLELSELLNIIILKYDV